MADEVRWNPSKDSEAPRRIEGEVIGLGEATSVFGKFKTLQIRAADGTVYGVGAYHNVLKRQVDEAGLEPGTSVAIEYLGMQRSKNDRDFHNYSLDLLNEG